MKKWFDRTSVQRTSIVRWDREKYIPLHVLDLVGRLYTDLEKSGESVEPFRQICRLVLSLLHQHYRRRHQHLTWLYSSLDPDRDRVDGDQPSRTLENESEAAIKANSTKFFQDFADVLERANYRRLSPHQIQLAVGTATHWGVKLRVRFSMFRRLEVYARGDIEGTRYRRRWYRFWVREAVNVPMYQRLVVLFQVKNGQTFDEYVEENCIHLRMFKNIPMYDIDMVLPGTGVRISWLDHGKIGIPSLWGLAILIWKILKNASILALLGIVKLFASVVLTIAVLIATLFILVKSFFSYHSTKRRYLLDVARNLYYQNLDNNMGGLLRLLDEAEQQEGCESLLAYYVMSQSDGKCWDTHELDKACESKLHTMGFEDVDFDTEDALRDLIALGIVEAMPDGWMALPPSTALLKLNKTWDDSFSYPSPLTTL
ncbi:MAG: TMEM143 family protein [Pirellulales bacterium]